MRYDIIERLRNLESATTDEAASLIDALRKANSEVMATGIKSVRDVAELAIELRETKAERDKMARQLDEYRESFANMARERDGLWDDLELVTRERDEARREVARLLDVETGHRIAIASLTAERDEARREVCQWEHHWDKTSSEQYYADKRGWDCYKEDKP